jgi:hypothetical protein
LSSILKALKKIEREFPEKSEIRSWQQEINTQKIVHKRMKDNLRFTKHFFIFLAAIILAAGGGLVLGRKPWEKVPSLVAKTETLPPKSSNHTGEKAVGQNQSQKLNHAKRNGEKITAVSQAANKVYHSAMKPLGNRQVLANKMEIKPEKPLTHTEKETTGQNSINKDRVTNKNTEKSEKITKAKRFASIPVKQTGESRLELQAIAWSSDPKSRIAVINGRVLREGESIERVLVTHIGKAEVIFRKGSEEWKQLFRLK